MDRPKCIIEGCNNNARPRGKDENGNTIFKKTCRAHHSDGSPHYRHRGKATTLENRRRFNKKVKWEYNNARPVTPQPSN